MMHRVWCSGSKAAGARTGGAMRCSSAVWGLVFAGAMASAQTTAPEHRVRVLGDTMAQRVVTRVEPVYPLAALEKHVAGEVTLYTAVGKDGAVEQVAVVDGPAALQRAATDAVKQWKFKPWLVNGSPVEVDTTIILDFRPGMSSAAPGVPGGAIAIAKPVGNASSTPVAPVAAVAPAAAQAPAKVASAGAGKAGGVDWETDRRAALVPAKPAVAAPATAAGSGPSAPVAAGEGVSGAAVRPMRASSGTAEASVPRGTRTPTGIVRKNDRTEWRLVKKVAPAYPQEAVDAGIEGVVVVAGVVKTDGMLRDLHVVSGPPALHQAAIDAAAQYVYEPVMRGDELGEASTQVPVVFTLIGPAKVAPEVMAGRILNSYTPPYPPEAIKQGVSGAVILHVLIGRQGEVKDVRVVSGREVLRATAVDAVKQWRYEPYKRNGVDVEVETDVEVQFSLIDR